MLFKIVKKYFRKPLSNDIQSYFIIIILNENHSLNFKLKKRESRNVTS